MNEYYIGWLLYSLFIWGLSFRSIKFSDQELKHPVIYFFFSLAISPLMAWLSATIVKYEWNHVMPYLFNLPHLSLAKTYLLLALMVVFISYNNYKYVILESRFKK